MMRDQRRPKNERKLNRDEKKNQQQNPFSERSVSSIAAVYPLDAVWYQMLTGASCEWRYL
jgi:hypothetical protein